VEPEASAPEPVATPSPSPAPSTSVVPITDAAAVRPSRGRPDASNVTAAIVSGRASDLQSNAEHLSTKARVCYRLKGPSGKTSLGGVSVRVAVDANGDVQDVTPERAEVDKVVLDCIVANIRRAHFASEGAPAVVSFDVAPPPNPEP
jgi:hypothetical protein